jgi:hypothetical protein
MTLFIEELEVLTNEGQGSTSPFAGVRTHWDSGEELARAELALTIFAKP